MNINFDIELTKSQKNIKKLIEDEDSKFVLLNLSRQSGKSLLCQVLSIIQLCTPDCYTCYITPTYALSEKFFDEIVEKLQPLGLIKKANMSRMLIESVFGSKLKFFSFQNPNNIRGFQVKNSYLIIDEAAFIADRLPDGSEPLGVLLPLIKAHFKSNKMIMISTPAGKRGMFYDFYIKALEGQKGYRQYTATIYDDELVNNEEIQFIKNSMSDIAFRQEFLVEFLDNGLTYFQGFEKCFYKLDYDEDVTQFIGIDLSSDGSDETVLTKVNNKKQVQQYIIKGTLDQKYYYISELINKTKNLKSVYIECNSIGGPMINEIKKRVNNKNLIQDFLTTNKTKNEILSAVAMLIAQKDIYFDEEDKQLYAQFSTFTAKFTKNGNVQLEALPGHHDDRILSLGIANYAREIGTALGSYNISFGARTTHKIKH